MNWCLVLSSLSYSDDGGSADGERDRADALSIVAFPARPGPFVDRAPPPGTLLSRFESVATSRGVLAFDFDCETRIRLDLCGCGATVCDRECCHRCWLDWGCCFGHGFFGRDFFRPSPNSGNTNRFWKVRPNPTVICARQNSRWTGGATELHDCVGAGSIGCGLSTVEELTASTSSLKSQTHQDSSRRRRSRHFLLATCEEATGLSERATHLGVRPVVRGNT